jgi:methyl-accepting chemotaxis protein
MKLADTSIGNRLAIGFSFTLLMLCLTVGLASWRLQGTRDAVEKMVNQTMLKERLVAEWAAATNINGARTIAVAESGDAARKEQVQKKIKETSARISEIQKQLESMDRSEEEKRLFGQIGQQRTAYVAAREAVFKEKEANEESARKLVQTTLEPALNTYVSSIGKLAESEMDAIAKMREEIVNMSAGSQRLLIALGILSTLLSIAVAFVIARSIRQQLGGEPAEAVASANRIAEGDLTARIDLRPGDATSLMHAIKQMQESLSHIVTDVRAGCNVIATASAEIATGNLDLSSRTEQQASSLQETASSMEELTSTVKHNADNARQANQLAASASAVASEGGAVVSQVVETMSAIDASSKKIVDIIGVIDGIAFQTNILALNAAVEAARASEQGSGFALVASEVRNLAQRSAGAAKEIKALIDDSVQKVKSGTVLVDKAGTTMQQVVDSVKRVSDVVGEIAAAGDEQRAGIEQVNLAITQMDQATQQNAALVEQAAAAAGSMQDQSAKLMQEVSVFRLDSAPAALTAPARSVPVAVRPKQQAAAVGDEWSEF